jgi:hypothetical protein
LAENAKSTVVGRSDQECDAEQSWQQPKELDNAAITKRNHVNNKAQSERNF